MVKASIWLGRMVGLESQHQLHSQETSSKYTLLNNTRKHAYEKQTRSQATRRDRYQVLL